MSELPKRKRPARQPVFVYGNRSAVVFVTVCTRHRQPILASDEAHRIIRQAWTQADHWLVGRYTLLPDHIHLFCSPARLDHLSVKRWITFWKSAATKLWPEPNEAPLWQPDGWDRQLRNGESYSAKWAYVRQNPVRHGLVAKAEDWPYQGEMNPIWWHD